MTNKPSPTIDTNPRLFMQYKTIHENGGFSKTECTNIPSPTITATQCRMYVIEDDRDQTKPIHE